MKNDLSVIISFENVTKSYGHEDAFFALNGISLDIAAGTRVAVMGPSGSGKSTLLNLICGLDEPTSGIVRFDGQDLTGMNDDARTRLRRDKIGMIFQTFNLLPTLTAVENVSLPLRLKGVSAGESAERARQMLERVRIAALAEKLPDEMSGGERQRVAIARALIFEPSVLLADEPTGNLDSHTGDEVLDLLDDLHKQFKTTIVMVTHNDMAASHCERHISLLDGQIVRDELSAAK